jgi:hypothetical protein
LFPAAGVAGSDGMVAAIGAVGPGPLERQYQSYVIKLNPSGAVAWQHDIGMAKVTGVVAVSGGYVVSQQSCIDDSCTCNSGLRLLRFTREGKLTKDWCSPLWASARVVSVTDGKIEAIRSACDESACTLHRSTFRDTPEMELIERDVLAANIPLPLPSTNQHRVTGEIKNIFRTPQGWILDFAKKSYESGYGVIVEKSMYAFDIYATLLWHTKYSKPRQNSFLHNLLLISDGYILSGISQSDPRRSPTNISHWLLRIDNKGRSSNEHEVEGDIDVVVGDRICGHSGDFGKQNTRLTLADMKGKTLWSAPSPVENGYWRNVPALLILDGDYLWAFGRSKTNGALLAAARLKIESAKH